ncbi:MAG: hypothetical protein NBKEAIPA_02991 [Nitrospirae bacterium]|nr:MAG: hypothetical protein UZ03_NOB001000341 [Nitrospira sp. OLB3]MBV6471064.1 hypothetical protein [Nitrospirota bacterium]MCE7966077.1 hypothetical protein [Nitrospira sp. NTP2]MCK6493626.1 hypothetical protein [Nitrospira sp.]MEB2338968.1 hypothetical protein [Nitrospirales bacterium]
MDPLAETPLFAPDEVKLLTDRDLFRAKERIVVKVREQLVRLHQGLQSELAQVRLLLPAEFDPTKAQMVKGEHLEHCPYQYLDYPKHFRGDEKLTFRSLCWWGHHLVFALIVEGGLVKQYRKNLVDRFHRLAGHDLELSLAPTLWEWKRGEGYTLPITHDRKAQVAAVLSGRAWFKIARFVPLDAPAVQAGGLPDLGRDTFRRLFPLLTP